MTADELLRTMCAEGRTWRQIGAALGLSAKGAHYRALTRGLSKAPCRPGTKPRHGNGGAHCRRCGILLTAAPVAGNGGELCGWCFREETRP